MKLKCPICSKEYEKSVGHYNRAIKIGANIYCSKHCSSIGRKLLSDKHLKTAEQLKAEKAEYDKAYRKKNSERIKKDKAEKFAIEYANNPDKFREQRKKRMPYHVEYCRKPEQREKERLRNRRKNGLTKLKTCLCCKEEKEFVHFEAYKIFPDGRNYMCKYCEIKEANELGITMREVLQTIRSGLVKHQSKLNIRDMVKYPYLIESHKYSLLLKRLTK